MIVFGLQVLLARKKNYPKSFPKAGGQSPPEIPFTGTHSATVLRQQAGPFPVKTDSGFLAQPSTRTSIQKRRWWKGAPKEDIITWAHSVTNVKNVADFNGDILRTTQLINQLYPELSKYLEEMTVTIPDVNCPKITNQVLMEYSESLHTLLNSYSHRQREMPLFQLV